MPQERGVMLGLSRRHMGIGAWLLALAASPRGALALPLEPPLWLYKRDGSKVYLFGFGEAENRSWLTPHIQRAFNESGELWLETPPDPLPRSSSQAAEQPSPLIQELGIDTKQSLFEVLGPALAKRTLAAAHELGVTRERLEHLRPWLAFFVINSAYQAGPGKRPASDYADQVLVQMAIAGGKPIHAEFATQDDAIRWFAALSVEAQREHLDDLLDYLDSDKKGLNGDRYGWIAGRLKVSSRNLELMRIKRPAYYQAVQVDRNRDWATRISGFLSAGGVYFVAIGMNHMVGPDSLSHQLGRRGIVPFRV